MWEHDYRDFKRYPLSASDGGRGVLVAATASPGTLIHTALSSIAGSECDETWLWLINTSGSAVSTTIQWGGTTAPNDSITVSVPANSNLVQVIPGLVLQNGYTVSAYAATANVIVVHGFVNRVPVDAVSNSLTKGGIMALSGNNLQVLVGGYELTADSNRVTINDGASAYDVTAFSDGVHKFIRGQRLLSLDHAGYMDSVAVASHPVLSAANISGMVSLFLGQNAWPAVGGPSFSLSILQGKYGTFPRVGRYVPFNAVFANSAGLGGWGMALAVPTSISATSNGLSVWNGWATTNGGAAFLHILQATSTDTYTFTIQGSTTGAFSGEQTTLGTFTSNGLTLTSEMLPLSSTIPAFTRWTATRTGSAGNTVRFAVTLVRF